MYDQYGNGNLWLAFVNQSSTNLPITVMTKHYIAIQLCSNGYCSYVEEWWGL